MIPGLGVTCVRSSVRREHLPDVGNIPAARQRQHQQNARFLRAQILAGDNSALAQTTARRDAAGRGTAALYDDDPGRSRPFERRALLRGGAPWREAGRAGAPRLAALAYVSLGDDAEAHARAYLTDYYSFIGEFADQIAAGAQIAKGTF